jgi:hypothetical protein
MRIDYVDLRRSSPPFAKYARCTVGKQSVRTLQSVIKSIMLGLLTIRREIIR